MEFRTIEAKRGGVCGRCKGEFPPGTRIRWAARQGSYHLASECPANVNQDTVATITETVLTATGNTPTYAAARTAILDHMPTVGLPAAADMLAAFGVKP